ncbi:MAG: fasciclin domain-containing protein [Cellvibrionaceae bacterium]|nr:fasciclin domain-containing protein [Cellvibrionaceae bacterium]
MKKILPLGMIVTVFTLFANLAFAGSDDSQQRDIVDTAVANGNFTTLVKAVEAADLVETLKGDGPFTLFAPTDEAFAKIPEETLNALIADKAALAGVLTYHVVDGEVSAAQVVDLSEAKTVQGQSLRIDVEDDKVFVDGAQLVMTDIKTSNGIIHVIDSVIQPK